MQQQQPAPANAAIGSGKRKWIFRLGVPTLIVAVALTVGKPAQAVPSFSDQTGQPCQACHVGGFGPQLTPFGREFKLGGYTMRTNKKAIPLSAMAIASYTHTRRDQTAPDPGIDRNDNIAFDQGSLFLAGGIGKHFGGFSQVTYDGVAKAWAWDNFDFRAVTNGHVFGQDAVFGLTLNNSPTVQDVWNTTPAWGFPYTDTAVSPTPGAAPLIDGALAQNVIGMSAYGWIGHRFYVEAGGYKSPSAGTLRWLGADPTAKIKGIAPYGRIAFQNNLGGGTLEVGAFALKAKIHPDRTMTSAFTDRYSDIGMDASFVRPLANGDSFTTNLRYIHEANDLKASCDLGLIGDGSTPACARTHLNEWRGDIGYSWRGKVGASLGAFSITGSRNASLYPDAPNARPDSNGVMGQLDYTPWGDGKGPLGPLVNLRLGVQYTAYGKFDGARHNYDGAGANASDNNALRVFTWLAF